MQRPLFELLGEVQIPRTTQALAGNLAARYRQVYPYSKCLWFPPFASGQYNPSSRALLTAIPDKAASSFLPGPLKAPLFLFAATFILQGHLENTGCFFLLLVSEGREISGT